MLVTEVAYGFIGSIILGRGVILLVLEMQWLFCVEEGWDTVVGGWAGFGIDWGLTFVAGFLLRIFFFAVGFLEVKVSSEDRVLRVIGGSDLWRG